MLKRISRIVLIMICIAFYDALIGGGIAAALQRGGWNQAANTMYQLGFAVSITVILVLLFTRYKWKKEVSALLILLIGFTEDTLYYILIPITNPVIKFITNGAIYTTEGGGTFPPQISGWLGWVTRVFDTGNISLNINTIFIINACAIVIAILILKHRKT